MNDYLTESEAWQAILDVIEMTGEMSPTHWRGNSNAPGLCSCTRFLRMDGLISMEVGLQMGERIKRALAPGADYLAPAYDAQARIPFLKRFIREARAEERAARLLHAQS